MAEYGYVTPAHEIIKQYTVEVLVQLNALYARLQEYMYMRKYPRSTVSQFKAGILSFYGFLRPKIITFSAKNPEYQDVVTLLDSYVTYPSRMRLYQSVEAFLVLNQFCEDIGLTRITHPQMEI